MYEGIWRLVKQQNGIRITGLTSTDFYAYRAGLHKVRKKMLDNTLYNYIVTQQKKDEDKYDLIIRERNKVEIRNHKGEKVELKQDNLLDDIDWTQIEL